MACNIVGVIKQRSGHTINAILIKYRNSCNSWQYDNNTVVIHLVIF